MNYIQREERSLAASEDRFARLYVADRRRALDYFDAPPLWHPGEPETASEPSPCTCEYTSGHAANCPAVLQTPEQRIRRAAHIFYSFDGWRACQIVREDGLSDAEIATGAKLAAAQKEFRREIVSYYGDPAYGSYTIRQADRERGERIEREIIDAHIAALNVERKPASFQHLTLEEELVGTIAIATFRKGQVA